MNWSDLITKLVAVAAACGTLLKAASWLSVAWKDKANAIREEAAAETTKAIEAATLAKEVSELRTTVGNSLARMQTFESRLDRLEGAKQQQDLNDMSGVVRR